jgi:hypothetical protein
MVVVGTERCDKVGGVIIKGVVLGDDKEEVLLDVFLLWASDLLAAFINNGVLVQVVGDSSGIRQGGEEIREELGFWVKREWEDREDRSRWGRRGNNGDRSFYNGWWEVLDWDIGE